MKYKLSEDNQRRLEQFARTNYAQWLSEILLDRRNNLNDAFRAALPDNFLQVQGRALEIDELLTALKIKVRED